MKIKDVVRDSPGVIITKVKQKKPFPFFARKQVMKNKRRGKTIELPTNENDRYK